MSVFKTENDVKAVAVRAWQRMQVDYHGAGTEEDFVPYLSEALPLDEDLDIDSGLLED